MADFPGTGLKLRSELISKAWQKLLVKEHKNDTLFTALTGIIDNTKNVAVPGVVVEKNKEISDGSTSLTMPFLNKLTNAPVIGDQDLLGQEEKQKVRFVDVEFDDVQQGVAVKNKGLVAHRNKFYSMISQAQPQLRDWWNEHLETEHFATFVNGWSTNLTSADSQIGNTAELHALIYTANAGRVTFSGTAATYATNLNAAIDALDTAGTTMSIAQLDRMSLAAKQNKIRPFKTSGGNKYAVFLHENSVYDLRTGNTSEWNNLMKDAESRGGSNRALNNFLGTYRDLMLFEATRAPTVDAITASDSVTFNLATVATERPTLGGGDSSGVVNILAGDNALFSAVAGEIDFDEEFYSYKFTKGIGTHKLYGYRRPDFSQETGESVDSLQSRYNQSSLLWLTDSVSPI